MKVKTLGGLAALGMFLSSLTVWSITKPKLQPEPGGAWTDPGGSDPIAPEFTGASFTAGKTLMVEGRLGHARMLASQDNETMLLVDVTADRNALTTTSAPLNLAIVVDRSGSMKGKRLANALDAARGMVTRLRDGDVVSVISYNTNAEVVVPPTSVDSFSRQRVASSLSNITASGDTCISCGLDQAMIELRQQSGMIDRILLLSDGEATAGVRDVEGFRNIGSRIRSMGASVSSIGVDIGYNERVMNALAVESNGRHYFVENAGDLGRVFDQELDTLQKSLAKDAEVSVRLAPGVELGRVFDRTSRRDGDKVIVPMGSFSAGEEKTLLVSLRVPRGAAGERPIADVAMTYADLSSSSTLGTRGECQGKLAALLTDDASSVSDLDPFVSTRALRSQTATTLTEANDLFNAGRPDEARRKLSSRLDALNRERAAAVAAAPAPAKAKLEKDFAAQGEALDEATTGFATPPAAAGAAPPAPSDDRKGQAQVKNNAVRAFDLER
jgi:Ca-activated chloride channel homolog